jgi:hypothetical protein
MAGHNVLTVKQCLTDKSIPDLKHSLFTGFNPLVFYLLSKVQNALEGIHFQFTDKVMLKMTNLLYRVTACDLQHQNPILPHSCYML